MLTMELNSEELSQIQRLREFGDAELAAQFEKSSTSLRNMILYRLPESLKRRVDAADVLQDTFLEASRRLPDYLENPGVAPHTWLRQLTRNIISRHHRFHTVTEKRSTERETSIRRAAYADIDSIVACLSESIASPLSQIVNAEIQDEFRQLLKSMDDIDREVLCLKQLERLSFTEVAAELEIDVSAAKRRFQRAALKLRRIASHLNTTSHAC